MVFYVMLLEFSIDELILDILIKEVRKKIKILLDYLIILFRENFIIQGRKLHSSHGSNI